MLECKKLLQMENKEKTIPKYESLFYGNVKEKIEIARQFKQNMKIREISTSMVPSDRMIFMSVIFRHTKLPQPNQQPKTT